MMVVRGGFLIFAEVPAGFFRGFHPFPGQHIRQCLLSFLRITRTPQCTEGEYHRHSFRSVSS